MKRTGKEQEAQHALHQHGVEIDAFQRLVEINASDHAVHVDALIDTWRIDTRAYKHRRQLCFNRCQFRVVAKEQFQYPSIGENENDPIRKHCIDRGCELVDLTVQDMQQFSPVIEKDVYEVISIDGSVQSRISTGGTSLQRVEEALRAAEKQVGIA